MNLDKKTKIGIVVGVVIVILVLVFNLTKKPAYPPGVTPPSGGGNQPTQSTGPVTREPVPQNVAVPEMNSKNVPANVAKPDVVAPGNPTSNSSYRSFEIKAQDGKFTPDTVIANEEDTISILVTAVDKDYDFTQPDFGFKPIIKKGSTVKIQVT